jgi:hypothetical protein
MQFPSPCPLIPQPHDSDAEAVKEANAEDKYRYENH